MDTGCTIYTCHSDNYTTGTNSVNIYHSSVLICCLLSPNRVNSSFLPFTWTRISHFVTQRQLYVTIRLWFFSILICTIKNITILCYLVYHIFVRFIAHLNVTSGGWWYMMLVAWNINWLHICPWESAWMCRVSVTICCEVTMLSQ